MLDEFIFISSVVAGAMAHCAKLTPQFGVHIQIKYVLFYKHIQAQSN